MALALLIAVSGVIWWRPHHAHAQTDTFTISGTWVVPSGVSSAIFEAWGGGGGGGGGANGSGGGGGNYANITVSGLVTNDNYPIVVGAGGTGGTSTANGCHGAASTVTNPSSTVILQAAGGTSGTTQNGTSCNATSTNIGSTINLGGSGGLATSGVNGGGGGGGAGSTGAGGNASGSTPGTGTANNGGDGGAGATSNANGNPGSNYGGGGGAALFTKGSSKTGGAGAQGLVTVTYSVSSNSAPSSPTLSAPTSGATGISVTPNFTLSTTDPDSDAIKYRLYLYQNDCSTAVGFSPFAQASSGAGWDNGTTAYTSGATATYTYQGSLSYNTQYCWKADAIDPAGSNAYGTASSTQLFTTIANSAPGSPSLTAPSSGATGVSTTPTFSFSDTDPDSDDIQFKINLFQSDCSTSVATYDMASGQTGWATTFNGTAGSGLTYTSATAGGGVSFTPTSALSNSTTYCWSVSAKDPGGSNTTTTSGTQSFTTAAASSQVNIGGGVNITGGTNVY